MITLLVDLGASPNMVDLKGRSPAMRAAEFGHVQALTLLTDADTDLTSKDFGICKNGFFPDCISSNLQIPSFPHA